jgi:hypothetical protein
MNVFKILLFLTILSSAQAYNNFPPTCTLVTTSRVSNKNFTGLITDCATENGHHIQVKIPSTSQEVCELLLFSKTLMQEFICQECLLEMQEWANNISGQKLNILRDDYRGFFGLVSPKNPEYPLVLAEGCKSI